MKKTILKTAALLLIFSGVMIACGKDDNENNSCDCENKEIIRGLKDEPAIVSSITFSATDFKNLFGFKISNDKGLNDSIIIPCHDIPEKYRINDLPVYINGNVTNCYMIVDDYLPENNPPIPFQYKFNMFELTNIKTR
jgi:protein involved in sex pheromone biosynthesis